MTTYNGGKTACEVAYEIYEKGSNKQLPFNLREWWNRFMTDTPTGKIDITRGGVSDSYMLKVNDPDEMFAGWTPFDIISSVSRTDYHPLDAWAYWNEEEGVMESTDDVYAFIDDRRWVWMTDWLEFKLEDGIIPDLPFLKIKRD